MIAIWLTEAQATTLLTIAANGGEMNSYARQAGFHCNSVPALIRTGMLERVAPCTFCAAGDDWAGLATDGCQRMLPSQRGGQRCYRRVRLTDAGRDFGGSR